MAARDSSPQKRTARAGTRSLSITSSTTGNGEAPEKAARQAPAAPRRDAEQTAALTAYPVEDLAAPLLDADQQAEVMKLVTYGSSPLMACHKLGVSITSFLKTSATDAGFGERLQAAQQALSQNVAARLYQTAMNGNVSAQKCYLEFRPPPEWDQAPNDGAGDEELDPHDLAEAYRAAGLAVPPELEAFAGRENGRVES
jgi:hypothetical protein